MSSPALASTAPGSFFMLEWRGRLPVRCQLSDVEVVQLKFEHAIIDDALLQALFPTSGRRRRRFRKPGPYVRALFVLGMPVETIEDFFDLTTDEVRTMTRDLWATAVRALCLRGTPTREIQRRLELPLKFIRDIARDERTKEGEHVMPATRLSAEKIESIRRRYTEGLKIRDIAAVEGVSIGSVVRSTKDLPGRCAWKGRALGPRRPKSDAPEAEVSHAS